MRKLTFGMNLSLDGYIAAPGDDLGWSVPSDELFQWWSDRVGATGLALYGRKLWETMSSHWPTADQQPGATPGNYIVQFTMPSKYTLQTLPKPNDAQVRLRQLPDRLVAVRAYGGGWSLARYDTELAALREAMQRDGLVAISTPQWARYNSPISLPFMRRNEIWLEIDMQ